MLKYITNVVENCRIKKLETEMHAMRGELDYLRKQNLVMIESIENINKYEKLLIEKIEELTLEVRK